jgi:hypothetical protein
VSTGHWATGHQGEKASEALTARVAVTQSFPTLPLPADWRSAVTSKGIPVKRARASCWVEPTSTRCRAANGVSIRPAREVEEPPAEHTGGADEHQ